MIPPILKLILNIMLLITFLIVNTKNIIEKNIDDIANKVDIHRADGEINQSESIFMENETNLISLQARKEDVLLIEIEELENKIELSQTKMHLLKELRDDYLNKNKILPVTIYKNLY